MSEDSSLDWLLRDGSFLLETIPVISTRPFKVDWSGTRLTMAQQAILMEQLQLRMRARERFPEPNKWLWTDRSYQQASDWQSAVFKASLFAERSHVVDGCCGAGVDLVAQAQRHSVIGIDRDRQLLRLAQFNLQRHARNGGLLQSVLPGVLQNLENVCLHIDPDRRQGFDRQTRTTHGQCFSPTLSECLTLGNSTKAAIIKLAPATEVETGDNPKALEQWRRCWLGTHRECPQQLLVRGELTWEIPLGHVGVVLVSSGDRLTGRADQPVEATDTAEEFIYEPHAAIYAAGITGHWAQTHDCLALPHQRSYFTSSRQIDVGPWAQCYRMLETMSWDERRVKKWLRQHHVGQLEVKTRNVKLDANQLQRTMSTGQGQSLTCLLYALDRSIRVIMAQKCHPGNKVD